MKKPVALVLCSLIVLCCCTQGGDSKKLQNTKPPLVLGAIPLCGTVQFSDGCGEQLDSLISYGLALVHHMTYTEAEAVFDRVVAEDSSCFWGHWGKALTYIHPVWPDAPTEAQLTQGRALSQRALGLAGKEKEKAYARALDLFYQGELNKTKAERLKDYETGWKQVSERFPKDIEAKSFYALNLVATADPGDKSYKSQRMAGALAEEVLKTIPDHPGGFHYAIHAYDNPALGNKAISVANQYGKIAPEVPHALHMPSHIFTRQGMWQESIEWNRRSAKAALANPAHGAVSVHYLHALDYLVYAHLQRGEDKQVKQLLDAYKEQQLPYPNSFITAYALAALESRPLLERGDWDAAAQLAVQEWETIPWEQYPECEALIQFAKGLGSARSGRMLAAEEALARLAILHQNATSPYWKTQIEIQRHTVQAWLAYAKGNNDQALNAMQQAAALETATEKHPVTPGELLPAVELLGELLLVLNKPAESLQQYEAALQRSPTRLNSLYGAARAAAASGNAPIAKHYYGKLTETTAGAEVPLKHRENAMTYLKL